MEVTFDKISGVLRHLLTAGAGFLVAKGYFDAGMTDQIVSAVLLLAGVVWSWRSKSA